MSTPLSHHDVVAIVPLDDLEAAQTVLEAQQLGLPPPKFSALNPRFVIVFASICAVQFLAGLDSSVLSTALPLIANEYNNTNLYAWVINSYLIASTIMIPISAQLSEIMGRKNLLMVSIGIFLFGSVLSGLASSMAMLVAFRAIQGFGAGPISSVGGIVTSDIVPPRFSGKFNGILGVITALSVVGGPVFGGLITDQNTWRLIFWINLPIGIPSVVALWWFLNYEKERALREQELEQLKQQQIVVVKVEGRAAEYTIPEKEEFKSENAESPREEPSATAPARRGKRSVLQSIDWLGMVLLLASILLALLASSFGSAKTFTWGSSEILGMFGGGILAFFLFLLNEAFLAKEPVLPLNQFKNVYLTSIYIIKFSIQFILMGVVSYIPLYFQIIRDSTPTMSGVKMLPLMFSFMIASTLCGFVISKKGIGYPFLIVGMALTLLAVGLLTLIRPSTTYGSFLPFLSILGLGLGFVTQVVTVMLLAAVTLKEVAATVVSDTFVRTAGGIVGVQVFQLIIQNYLDAKLSSDVPLDFNNLSRDAINLLPADQQTLVLTTYTKAMEIFFYVCIPIATISFLLTLPLYRINMPSRNQKISRMAAAL